MGPVVGEVVGAFVGLELTGLFVGLSVGDGVGGSWQYISIRPHGSTPFHRCVTEPIHLEPSAAIRNCVTSEVNGMLSCSTVSLVEKVTSMPK